MADLTYSAALQNLIALRAFGKQYSALLTDEKTQIDNVWTSGTLSGIAGGCAGLVLTTIQQRAQAFYQAGATAAPDVWANVFVPGVCALVMKNTRPDRQASFWSEYRQAWELALDSFSLDDATSASSTSGPITIKGLRFYVMDKGARLSPRKFFSTAAIDTETTWVLSFAWNHAAWRLRQRQARMSIKTIAFSAATWTESTKTLALVGGFSALIQAGDRVRIDTGSSGVMPGDYVSSQSMADSLVLTTSLSEGAVSLASVSGAVVYVRHAGLGASETFDSIASQKWHMEAGGVLEWASVDRIAELKASTALNDQSPGGQPQFFHVEERVAYKVWHFWPEPDQTYYARGAVLVAGPSTASTSTDSTPFDRFPAAMRPHLRDLVLGRVFQRHGVAAGDGIWSQALTATNALFANYEDPGAPDNFPEPTDRSHDADEFSDGFGHIGGIN